jgi:hypothetical protein
MYFHRARLCPIAAGVLSPRAFAHDQLADLARCPFVFYPLRIFPGAFPVGSCALSSSLQGSVSGPYISPDESF